MKLGTLREWMGYSIVLVVLLLIVPPFMTRAEGEAADRMCDKAKPECPCAEVKNKKTGKCEKKSIDENPFMCPMYCKDDTNGHKTVGHCVATSKCKGDTCDGKPCEKAKEGGKPPEMPKMPEPPKGGDGKAPPTDPNATSTEWGKLVDFVGTSTAASSSQNYESTSPPLAPTATGAAGIVGDSRSILEGYIQQLRGYFGGMPDAAGRLHAGDPATSAPSAGMSGTSASGLQERGFNTDLGNINQLSPFPGSWLERLEAIRDSSSVSNGAGLPNTITREEILRAAGVQGQIQIAEREGESFFRESPATGFLPPHADQSSGGFFEGRWKAIKALLGF